MILGDHLIPREVIAWFCLGFWCIPVLFRLVFFSLLSLFLQMFPFFDLIVPEFYVSDVSVDCRALGLPRLAMMMGSSSLVALLLAAF